MDLCMKLCLEHGLNFRMNWLSTLNPLVRDVSSEMSPVSCPDRSGADGRQSPASMDGPICSIFAQNSKLLGVLLRRSCLRLRSKRMPREVTSRLL